MPVYPGALPWRLCDRYIAFAIFSGQPPEVVFVLSLYDARYRGFMRILRWSTIRLCGLMLAFMVPFAYSADGPCLDKIYPAGEPRNKTEYEFDQGFDGDSTGAYSCQLQMRPSELRKALEKFRYGVLYNDAASISTVARFPINVRVGHSMKINPKTTKIRVRNASEWFAFQKKYFSKTQTALVACAYLGDVTLAGGRSPGVMIGLGEFWFQSFVGSWRVKLTAVNLLPVDATVLAKSCTPPGAEGD
jgi:hypothetical protein